MVKQEQGKQHTEIDGLPTLTLGVGDLRILDNLLRGYLNYTRQMVRSSPKRNTQTQLLEGIRHRLKTAILSFQLGSAIRVPLTYREFQVLDEALAGYIKITRYRIAVSREREEFLAEVAVIRQAIARVPIRQDEG